ncbi:hypothetical protein [Mesorhizobium sp.]|nr:hypothetical protein [Mesorhizobium sp.]
MKFDRRIPRLGLLALPAEIKQQFGLDQHPLTVLYAWCSMHALV